MPGSTLFLALALCACPPSEILSGCLHSLLGESPVDLLTPVGHPALQATAIRVWCRTLPASLEESSREPTLQLLQSGVPCIPSPMGQESPRPQGGAWFARGHLGWTWWRAGSSSGQADPGLSVPIAAFDQLLLPVCPSDRQLPLGTDHLSSVLALLS